VGVVTKHVISHTMQSGDPHIQTYVDTEMLITCLPAHQSQATICYILRTKIKYIQNVLL